MHAPGRPARRPSGSDGVDRTCRDHHVRGAREHAGRQPAGDQEPVVAEGGSYAATVTRARSSGAARGRRTRRSRPRPPTGATRPGPRSARASAGRAGAVVEDRRRAAARPCRAGEVDVDAEPVEVAARVLGRGELELVRVSACTDGRRRLRSRTPSAPEPTPGAGGRLADELVVPGGPRQQAVRADGARRRGGPVPGRRAAASPRASNERRASSASSGRPTGSRPSSGGRVERVRLAQRLAGARRAGCQRRAGAEGRPPRPDARRGGPASGRPRARRPPPGARQRRAHAR